ncbi:MAG: NADH-quinone oxidoreductase subunit D [Planctomycetota bacterium]|jgi:NADH-quinone oxidoreductase subunit D|nr:NADH-quinone oxidoreductase subunit D [Planctomycetota bacterium]
MGEATNVTEVPLPQGGTVAVKPGDFRTEEMLLNIGPQHPSTHGVLRVVVRTDGEIILDSQVHIGYLHRCFEKVVENVTWTQVTPYTDRMDYLASMYNNLGYSLAVEKLGDVEVPERASYIRIIIGELQRIASHLMSVGTYGLDVGAITAFLYCFRDREITLRIFEEVCGQRLNYNYIRPGGVSGDLTDEMLKKIDDFIDYFLPKIDEIDNLLSMNGIFIYRTAGVGILPLDLALDYGCTGPVLRGSGLARDLRKDEPYGLYEQFDFDVITGKGEKGQLGDCWDRYMIRVREMRESCKIIKQALAKIPEGKFIEPKLLKNVKVKKGESYLKVENPRGELGYYIVSDGKKGPYRCSVRAPSFCNIAVLPEISRGCMVADMVVIIGSIDIVMGEVDR